MQSIGDCIPTAKCIDYGSPVQRFHWVTNLRANENMNGPRVIDIVSFKMPKQSAGDWKVEINQPDPAPIRTLSEQEFQGVISSKQAMTMKVLSNFDQDDTLMHFGMLRPGVAKLKFTNAKVKSAYNITINVSRNRELERRK